MNGNDVKVSKKVRGLGKNSVEYYFVDLQDDGTIKNWVKENPENRVIDKGCAHIKNLANKMRRYGFVREKAMVVDSKYVIKAGHHRFHACQRLEQDENKGNYKGAWIVIDDNFNLQESTEIDDTVQKWGTMHWIVYHARQGNGEYKKIVDFIETSGLGIKAGMSLLLGSSSQSSGDEFIDLREGRFKVKDWNMANKRLEYIKSLGQYLDNPKEWKSVHLVTAIQKCFKVEGFDPDVLLHKISKQTRKFRVQRRRKDMLEVLQDIYNYMRKEGSRINLT